MSRLEAVAVGERVAMDLELAGLLANELSRAAAGFDYASFGLGDAMGEAALLLDEPVSPVGFELAGLATDLSDLAADVGWRTDFMAATNAEVYGSGLSLGVLPTGAPRPPVYTSRVLADMLAAAVAERGDFEELAGLVDVLWGQRFDPAYVAAVFDQLGAEATFALTVELSNVMLFHFGFDENVGGALTVDQVWGRLSEVLAVASNATTSSGTPVLGIDWFDGLFRAAGYHGDRTLDFDARVVNLFTTGRFASDVAVRVGTMGIELLAGSVSLTPRAEAVYDPESGEYDFVKPAWQRSAAVLLNPAAAAPVAAVQLLLAPVSTGRTGAAVLADRDNNPNSAAGIAGLVVAATITAETEALNNPDAVDMAALEDAWTVRVALIDQIAGQVRGDSLANPYPPELNSAFTEMTVATIPHLMRVPSHGDTPIDIDFDPTVDVFPSAAGGIYIDPETLSNLFGGLFRIETDRTVLLDAVALEQRSAYLQNPTAFSLERVGLAEGAVTNGFNIANIDDANQVSREIAEANARVDMIFAGIEVVLQTLPQGAVVLAGLNTAGDFIGVNPIDDYLQTDSDNVVDTAEDEAVSELYLTDVRARHFVFGRAFEQMQAQYLIGGQDALTDTSTAIFNYMQTEPALAAVYQPGYTTIGDLRTAGEAWNEYDSATSLLTSQDPALKSQLGDFRYGLELGRVDSYTD